MSNAVEVTAGDHVAVPSLHVVRDDGRSCGEFLDLDGIRS